MGYSLGGGVALPAAARHPVKVRRLVAVSAHIRTDAICPEMRAQQSQVSVAAVEFLKDTPMYQLYQRVAPGCGTADGRERADPRVATRSRFFRD